MTPEGQAIIAARNEHAIARLLANCNRVIGFMDGMADRIEPLSKDHAETMRRFSEHLDKLRAAAQREWNDETVILIEHRTKGD